MGKWLTGLAVVMLFYIFVGSPVIDKMIAYKANGTEIEASTGQEWSLVYSEALQKADKAEGLNAEELEKLAEDLFLEKDRYKFLEPTDHCLLLAIYYQNKAITKRLKRLAGEE